ncbi:ParB/RepB/Spo0J family partition protein [Candidatus Dependentiae bacterium]|nr:MAG: ParB/RepB/Spo0J family partition protein [Candidatus Dependentiae bacterium]
MSASTQNRSPKPISKDRLQDAATTLGQLVGEFGWIVNVSKLDTLTKVDVEWIEGASRLSADLVCPDNVWRIIDIPRAKYVPGFANENDARAIASALIMSRQDFIDAAHELQLDRMLRRIPDNGIVTPFGDVFCQLQPSFAVWFGRKAGRAPSLHDEAGLQAIAKLFTAPSDQPQPTELAAKAVPPKSTGKRSQPAAVDQMTRAELQMVCIHDIASDPENDRKTFDKAELQELAQSIMRHGVLQPILLRPDPDRLGSGFIIVAGERRWRAAKLAGLVEVPAQITQREGLQVSLARLDENLKRVDLSPIEKAQALRRLMDTHGLTQKEVGEAVGVQQGQISNMLRLLNLPESLQQRVSKSELAPTLVRPLLPFADVPAVAELVDGRIEFALKNEDEISAGTFERWVDEAVEKCSRSISMCPDFRKPTKADRCFGTISKDQEKALDLREVNGRPRAFNLQEFDRLNKEPLATKLAAYKKKAARSSGSGATAAQKEKPLKEYSEHRVKSAIGSALISGLATALQKDSPESNRVLITLAIHGCFSGLVPWCENKALKIFAKVPADSRQALAMLRSAAAKSLKDSRLTAAEIIGLGDSLRVDLAATWKASKEVVDSMTMTGLKQVARAIDVDESLFVAEAKLRAAILKAWPAGYVPPFLASMIGKKDSAKKQKAA